MKHIFLNLKRFDVPVELGGVNRLAPVAEWGRAIVAGTQQGLTGYDPAEAEFVDFFPEAHLIPAAAARTADSRVELGCQNGSGNARPRPSSGCGWLSWRPWGNSPPTLRRSCGSWRSPALR